MLPFETLDATEPFQVAGFSLPRYGCVTVNEAIALDSILNDESIQELLDSGTIAAEIFLQQLLTTILLISRDSPSWTLEDVQALSLDELWALSTFLLEEKTRKRREDEDGEAGKPIDWAELYWLTQLYYPHEPRFNRENFGSCPIILIEQALEAYREQELLRQDRQAVPIALMGAYLMKPNFKDPQPDWINPYGKVLKQREARAEMPKSVAQCFLDLCKEGLMPPWVVASADIDRIRLAAGVE